MKRPSINPAYNWKEIVLRRRPGAVCRKNSEGLYVVYLGDKALSSKRSCALGAWKQAARWTKEAS